MEYLFLLSSLVKTGIVEVGRRMGGSLFVMASANQDVKIFSIDINPNNDALLQAHFRQHGIGDNVEFIVGDSQNLNYPQIGDVDLVFIDGDHSHPQVTRDLHGVMHLVRDDTILCWHDYWLAGVPESVAEAQKL